MWERLKLLFGLRPAPRAQVLYLPTVRQVLERQQALSPRPTPARRRPRR